MEEIQEQGKCPVSNVRDWIGKHIVTRGFSLVCPVGEVWTQALMHQIKRKGSILSIR